MWGHRARRTNQSIKKPIESLLILTLFRPFLKTLMLAESMTCWGKQFHRFTTLWEKKCRLMSNEQWFFWICAEWPLVLLTGLSVKHSTNSNRLKIEQLKSLLECTPLYEWSADGSYGLSGIRLKCCQKSDCEGCNNCPPQQTSLNGV